VTYSLLPPPQPCVYHFELHSAVEDRAPGGHEAEGAPGQAPPSTASSTPPAASADGSAGRRDQDGGSSISSPFNKRAGRGGFAEEGGFEQQAEGLGGAAQEGGSSRAPNANDAGASSTQCSLQLPRESGGEGAIGSSSSSDQATTTTTLLASIPLVLYPPEAPVPEPDAAPKVISRHTYTHSTAHTHSLKQADSQFNL